MNAREPSRQWSEDALRRLASVIDATPVPGAVAGCCGEAGCCRRHPIGIYRGDFTGQVYAATSMRLVSDHGDGTGTFAASVKHDITRQMVRFIRANEAWVREVLKGGD